MSFNDPFLLIVIFAMTAFALGLGAISIEDALRHRA